MTTSVLVTADRWERWVAGFAARNGPSLLTVDGGGLVGRSDSGAWFAARLPFDHAYDGPADAAAFAAAAEPPPSWGVLLVRKGGFAIARMHTTVLAESKVGQRHVQGRTKAGGQSQQRFARRRDNQATAAFAAAADHAARLLSGATSVERIVTGGDRAAVAAVLADPRLRPLVVDTRWCAVPDPRRAVLERAVRDAQAIGVDVRNRRADGGAAGAPEA